MKTKQGNWTVECENKYQTMNVIRYTQKSEKKNWNPWKYVWYNSEEYYVSNDLKKLKNRYPNAELISFEEWEKLPNEEIQKELIGWKLSKDEYREASRIIAQHTSYITLKEFEEGYNFTKGSLAEKRIKRAGVLELWFEPVYKEEEFVLPEKYCVKNNGEHQELIDYANKYGRYSPYSISEKFYFHFPNCVRLSCAEFGYTEITFEQFKEHVLNKEPKTDAIVDEVIEDFKSRSELGIKKYGTTLDENKLTFNEWVIHMREELMDGILYLKKLEKENQ